MEIIFNCARAIFYLGCLIWVYLIFEKWKLQKKEYKRLQEMIETLEYLKKVKQDFIRSKKPQLTLIKTEEKE